MCAMSPRLLRPVATGFHPEANAWRSAVVANGGSVSASTMKAVSKFCADIDKAGIRDRFYRLNLFCGDTLNAVLVPLYKAESAGAAARGNATDSNNNFVSGDYTLAGGLAGNGTNKHLSTGLAANSVTASNAHLGVGVLATDTNTGYRTAMGAFDSVSGVAFLINLRRGDSVLRCFTAGSATDINASAGVLVQSAVLAGGNIVGSNPSVYRNGSQFGTDATTSSTMTSPVVINAFANNNVGTAAAFTNARLGWYSVGLGMSAAQVGLLNNAIDAFYTSIGRS
jgi:hypothetical protein